MGVSLKYPSNIGVMQTLKDARNCEQEADLAKQKPVLVRTRTAEPKRTAPPLPQMEHDSRIEILQFGSSPLNTLLFHEQKHQLFFDSFSSSYSSFL